MVVMRQLSYMFDVRYIGSDLARQIVNDITKTNTTFYVFFKSSASTQSCMLSQRLSYCDDPKHIINCFTGILHNVVAVEAQVPSYNESYMPKGERKAPYSCRTCYISRMYNAVLPLILTPCDTVSRLYNTRCLHQ